MKVFCSSLAHESNSFSPIPTNLANYELEFLYFPEDFSTGRSPGFAPDDCLRRAASAANHNIVNGVYASACPSAPTSAADYELLRDKMLACLAAANDLDMVLLFLHGAQMAVGYPDCEGDLLQRVREIVGPSIPVGVLMDLHCNVSTRMVESATILMSCKEYPHTDFDQCAYKLVELMEKVVRGESSPTMALKRVPILGFFHTTRDPMKSLVAETLTLESEENVLSVSLNHGFVFGDSEDTGASVLVVTNGNKQLARRLADDLGKRLFALREQISAPVVSLEDALDKAVAETAGPVVIADTADNPGGGAAGDSTFILEALLRRGVTSAALAMICDPVAVSLAQKAGLGATLNLRLGGKCGPMSGQPLDVTAKVFAVNNDAVQNKFNHLCPLGPSVALQIDGVVVVVNSHREQVHDTACFTQFGVDPGRFHILVVKSAQHFHTAFAPIAHRIIYADPPGTSGLDFSNHPFRQLSRPIWPIDKPPFEQWGEFWGK